MNAHRLVSRRLPRRGSVYALVLSIAMLVTVVGVGALAAARVNLRASTAGDDWAEAGLLAFSACEQAVAQLNAEAAAAPDSWRSAYANGRLVTAAPLGGGGMQWSLVDPADGILTDDYSQSIRLYGIGKVGRAVRVYSVMLTAGGEGFDALRTACHARSSLILGGVPTFVGGPASTNGNARLDGAPRGLIEAASQSGSAAAQAGSVIPASPKVLPGRHAFDEYKARAATLSETAFESGEINLGALTPTRNDWGSVNADGVYYLRLPDAATVTINPSRVEGTLLIEAHPAVASQTLRIVGRQYWKPARPDYPLLITRGVRTVELGGAAAPFVPGSSVDPSEMRGLIALPDAAAVTLTDGFYLFGGLITGGTLTTSGVTAITHDPALPLKPPPGFQQGNVLSIAPGTWRWDIPPV